VRARPRPRALELELALILKPEPVKALQVRQKQCLGFDQGV
jgi:hypothetical protein